MGASRARHTRKARRLNKLKLRGRGGYRKHKHVAGRTGSIRHKQRTEDSIKGNPPAQAPKRGGGESLRFGLAAT